MAIEGGLEGERMHQERQDDQQRILDLELQQHIDKWEVGLAGYASTDLNGAARNLFGAAKQNQIALGGLVGYDFGPATAQVYLTRTVTETNYTCLDTRLFAPACVPLSYPVPHSP